MRLCAKGLRLCTASCKHREPPTCWSRSALADSAVWGSENYTYTAAEGAQGLVTWLNEKTAYSSFRSVHVVLPTGSVRRGNATLILPVGLNLVLQGQGMDAASPGSTALNLERQNLDLGAMLGDTGRIELRNMGIYNVRASRVSTATARGTKKCCGRRATLPRCACEPHAGDGWSMRWCVNCLERRGLCVEANEPALRSVAGC
jgi:hypothetical protein